MTKKKARKGGSVLLPVARDVLPSTPAQAWSVVEALTPVLAVVARVVADAAAGVDDATLAVEAGMVDAAVVDAARAVKQHHNLPAVRAWRKALSRLARVLGVARGGSQRARVAEAVRAARAWHKAQG